MRPPSSIRRCPSSCTAGVAGCNAGAKGAVEFAKLGYAVREMIGGYEYWAREGQPLENDGGPLPRTFDPLIMVVRP